MNHLLKLPLFDAQFSVVTEPAFRSLSGLDSARSSLEDKAKVFDFAKYSQTLSTLEGVVAAGGVVMPSAPNQFNQNPLIDLLEELNEPKVAAGIHELTQAPNYVGITQLPYDYPDTAIESLNRQRVRGFYVKVFDETLANQDTIRSFALRVSSLVKWHCELDISSVSALSDTFSALFQLPKIVLHIDPSLLSYVTIDTLLSLIDKDDSFLKLTLPVSQDIDLSSWMSALKKLVSVNPQSILIGSGLSAAHQSFKDGKTIMNQLTDSFTEAELRALFFENAHKLYR